MPPLSNKIKLPSINSKAHPMEHSYEARDSTLELARPLLDQAIDVSTSVVLRNGPAERSSTLLSNEHQTETRTGSVEAYRARIASQRADGRMEEVVKRNQMLTDLKVPVCDAPF